MHSVHKQHMPINMMHATTGANTLKKHMETFLPDRRVLAEENWNFTLAAQDRESHTENQTAVAQEINILMHIHKMIGMKKTPLSKSDREGIGKLTQNPGWIEYIVICSSIAPRLQPSGTV